MLRMYGLTINVENKKNTNLLEASLNREPNKQQVQFYFEEYLILCYKICISTKIKKIQQ